MSTYIYLCCPVCMERSLLCDSCRPICPDDTARISRFLEKHREHPVLQGRDDSGIVYGYKGSLDDFMLFCMGTEPSVMETAS